MMKMKKVKIYNKEGNRRIKKEWVRLISVVNWMMVPIFEIVKKPCYHWSMLNVIKTWPLKKHVKQTQLPQLLSASIWVVWICVLKNLQLSSINPFKNRVHCSVQFCDPCRVDFRYLKLIRKLFIVAIVFPTSRNIIISFSFLRLVEDHDINWNTNNSFKLCKCKVYP